MSSTSHISHSFLLVEAELACGTKSRENTKTVFKVGAKNIVAKQQNVCKIVDWDNVYVITNITQSKMLSVNFRKFPNTYFV